MCFIKSGNTRIALYEEEVRRKGETVLVMEAVREGIHRRAGNE
jgi:hypothetical protein